MNTTFSPDHPITGMSEWFSAKVDYFTTKVRSGVATQIEIIDNRDPEHPMRMVGDEVNEIAMKCFLILIGLPFYTIGVMAVHAIRCVTLVGTNLANGEFSEAFLSFIQEIWAVAKAPIYALAIEFYAILGIVCPLTMRIVIAKLERDWSGSERFHDIRRMESQDEYNNNIAQYFKERESKTTAFLAFCFQPLGELNDVARVHSYQIKNPAL
jgi:hypothetical protein